VRCEEGLLSDLEILERLVAEDQTGIFVSPLIDPDTQVGPASLDLRVGTELFTTQITTSTHVDLMASREEVGRQTREYFRIQRVGPGEAFVLHPGEFALAATLEYVRLPRDVAARLEGRSSLGRLGLQVHATAGFVDPGFEGALTFELINSGRLPVRFSPGLRLGQICFFRVHEVQRGYLDKKHSKYGRRLGVELSRVSEEPEIRSTMTERSDRAT
jgi:dCTP deaminase